MSLISTLRANNATPVPYQAGVSLQLQVLKNCCDSLPFPQSVTAVIHKTFDMTMSPVVEVTVSTQSGSNIRAVLKLYDRRFGSELREFLSKHMPHTTADEVAFQDYVRQGKMPPFLDELQETKRTSTIPPQPWYVLGDGPYTPEDKAKYEAALWQECEEHFDCETDAYARLEDLQGTSIPRLYAHVRLALRDPDVPQELLHPQTARYFEVKGILLELIPGHSLSDLATSPLAPLDRGKWPAIVQSAVDIVHQINIRGVLLCDCRPGNVVVKQDDSHAPVIIDFAQCWFKDWLVKLWEDGEDGVVDEDSDDEGSDDEEWDPDVEYCHRICNNPAGIGAVMTTRLLRTTGVKLDIKYPDYDKIIDDLKRSKKAGLISN